MPESATKLPRAALLGAVLALAATACDDPFAAFLLDVPERPSEAVLYDFVNGSLTDPPAFDVVGERRVRVDQTREWDFLFRIVGGAPELAPFSAAADSVTDAGFRRAETSFEGVLEAPGSGYDISNPQPVAVGDVLIVRSRVDRRQFLSCSQFAKIEVLDLDLSAGTLTFRYLVNPNCGDTVLEPGKHGEL